MLLVFANIAAYSTIGLLERFILLMSFIPLTKFFRTSLMNLGSGSDAVAERTGGAVSSAVSAFTAGSILSRFDGKSEKNGRIVDSGKMSGSTSALMPNAGLNTASSYSKSDADEKAATLGSYGAGAARKAQTVLKNATKPAELARLAGKGAAIAAGAGLSLGSVATGGNPLIGNSVMLKSSNSIFNQAEGWSIKDSVPEDVNVSQGYELTADGISGFNNDTTTFSQITRKNINESPASQSNFVASVDAYNQKSENAGNEVSLKRQDNGDIFGAVIPGVMGKTTSGKDEKGKVIFSESSYTGKGKLDNFKPLLNDFKNKKVQPNNTTVGEVDEEGIK